MRNEKVKKTLGHRLVLAHRPVAAVRLGQPAGAGGPGPLRPAGHQAKAAHEAGPFARQTGAQSGRGHPGEHAPSAHRGACWPASEGRGAQGKGPYASVVHAAPAGDPKALM
jgi:hypothetical protein